MRLDPGAIAAGFRLVAHDILASTNTEALALARHGERGPLWVTAREQSAGRGRRGAPWVSAPGNLYATLLLGDPAPPDIAPQVSFAAALAVHDAIIDCVGSVNGTLTETLALKWPNDVLCGGAKLAGILIEGESAGTASAVAIGIGVNCAHHPSQTVYPATDLAAAGVALTADDVFCALSGAMVRRLAQWRRGAGFAAIRADWLDRAAGIGGEMKVRLPGRDIVGRGEGLDAQGRLLLRLADGTLQTINAGEVFPLAAGARSVHAADNGRTT
jgi:BirA family transcriptional regulator, biotin operon repressor / biotin---[acetyl-CoA-carboxylase] ligase